MTHTCSFILILGKIMEQQIKDSINLNEGDLIHADQYGFIEARSCQINSATPGA